VADISGDMLLAFPELLKIYEVFKMRPRVGAGYGERYGNIKVEGYWSERKQSKMDVEGDLRTPNYQATFWVRDRLRGEPVVMEENYCLERKGKIFVVMDGQDFTVEGGFYKCLMQKLEGPTDQQVRNTNVDKAIRGDY